MKIRLFTIPNILTLSNLVCGSLAIVEILVYQDFCAAFVLTIVAAVFDFLDGMMARLLGQYSEIGRELDSLSDMVSFGLSPAIMMYTLFGLAEKSIENPLWAEWGQYIPLIIVCFSALRLAKFNIDKEQEESFIGLPTPANALFCLSLGVLVSQGRLELCAEIVAIVSVIMALLLIVPLKLLALKFKSLSWKKNAVRYIFILLSAVAALLLHVAAIPVIIAIYILISIVDNAINRSKANSLKINE